MTEKISIGNIVASPKGYLMRVIGSISPDKTICQFLNAPIPQIFLNENLRFLAGKERPSVPHNPDFNQLIFDRNIIVATYIPSVRRPQGRPTKKKKSIQELILAAQTHDEVLAIIAAHGFNQEKEDETPSEEPETETGIDDIDLED